jgi:nucleotide-binding universal stress UspA family protein
MYKFILVTLDRSSSDRVIIEHVKLLARASGARLLLLHVVTNAASKYHGDKASGAQVGECEQYLQQVVDDFGALGIEAKAELAYGEPVKQIIDWVNKSGCDLLAMATHGHQFVADLILGTVAIKVQHQVRVPVLMLRGR